MNPAGNDFGKDYPMTDLRILDAITSPADLKVLNDEELSILAQEIREEIITVTSKTGGHVASSLGAVEIILALHSMLDCPHDKLVFDVGHQAYAHKLVTGRLEQFKTLRSSGGLSGFLKPSESDYDTNPSGHASDSLSVALGLALARDLKGSDERVVAVIGDAALSGGMAFEALNHIGQAQTPMVIILNDNEMSISHNVGALVKHLGYIRTSSQYRRRRKTAQEVLRSGGALGQFIWDFGTNAKNSIKQFFLPHSMIFEQLGILCTVPTDGHDIGLIKETLEAAFEAKAPVLVHLVTRKGAGYEPAVQNPEKFHGIAPYDIATGEVTEKTEQVPTYTQVFGQALINEACCDDGVVAITAAMEAGTGLKSFAKKFPRRFFDVGIAEEYAVGLASGLAAGGKKPVVAIYSTFLQRAFDQLIIDSALANSNVVFAIDRAGIVGEDGATHHGIFDMAYTRMVPNMRVLAPSNEAELASALHTALALDGPVAVRYPRGEAQGVALPQEPTVFEEGKAQVVREGDDVAILAFGRMVSQARAAAEALAKQGINVRVVDMRWVKPLDAEEIARAAKTKLIVTVEEGTVKGGAGEGVLDELSSQNLEVPTLVLGIPDTFIGQGKTQDLLHDLKLDAEGITGAMQERLEEL